MTPKVKLNNKTVVIGVFTYVGSPVLVMRKKGSQVIGFDVDQRSGRP